MMNFSINRFRSIILSALLFSGSVLANDYTVWLGTPDLPTELNNKQVEEVVNVLKKADITDNVIVNINSLGGYNYLGDDVINAIKHSNATVTTRCIDQCLSNGAFILMAGDDIRIQYGALIMFHISQIPCEQGRCAAGREYVKKYPQFKPDFDKDVALFKMLDLHKILLPSEWEQLLNGRNVWLTQLQMRDRMNRYFNSKR